mgnify:CR=1 FL=1
MKRFGPKDECYAVLYNAKDAPYIEKLTMKDPNYLYSTFQEKYNDHLGLSEFIAIAKADDIVTFPGLSYCMQLILGSQTVRFNFMCAGSSGTIADPFKQTLYSEAASRINMTTSGTIARLTGPDAMQYIGNFPASFQTITVKESCINTTSVPNTGILLNRNMFSSSDIVHVSGGTAFTLGSRISFVGLP